MGATKSMIRVLGFGKVRIPGLGWIKCGYYYPGDKLYEKLVGVDDRNVVKSSEPTVKSHRSKTTEADPVSLVNE